MIICRKPALARDLSGIKTEQDERELAEAVRFELTGVSSNIR
jgi:hypothetical protein